MDKKKQIRAVAVVGTKTEKRVDMIREEVENGSSSSSYGYETSVGVEFRHPREHRFK